MSPHKAKRDMEMAKNGHNKHRYHQTSASQMQTLSGSDLLVCPITALHSSKRITVFGREVVVTNISRQQYVTGSYPIQLKINKFKVSNQYITIKHSHHRLTQ
jgi:hypothetical protein